MPCGARVCRRLRITIAAGRARTVPPARRNHPPLPPLAEGRAPCGPCVCSCLRITIAAGRARAVPPARHDRPPQPALAEGAHRMAHVSAAGGTLRSRREGHAMCHPRYATALRWLRARAMRPICLPPPAQALAATGPSIDVIIKLSPPPERQPPPPPERSSPASVGTPAPLAGKSSSCPPRRRHCYAHAPPPPPPLPLPGTPTQGDGGSPAGTAGNGGDGANESDLDVEGDEADGAA